MSKILLDFGLCFSSLSAPQKGNAMTAYSVEDRTPGHVSLVDYMLLILIFIVMLVIRSILYVGRAFLLFICKKTVKAGTSQRFKRPKVILVSLA